MAENRNLLDLLTCSDYSPRQSTSRREDEDLRSQVQFLQDEVAVLQRCLRDSLDLQRTVIDCMSPDEGTVPVVSRPKSSPLAASTPYVQGQAPVGDLRSDFANVPHVCAPMVTQPALADLSATSRVLASVLHQSRLEPLIFDGEGKPSPEDWLQSVDIYRTSLDLTDSQMLLELPRFLSKEPKKWFNVLSSHLSAWAQFCDLFRKVFLPSDNQERIMRGILDRVQMPDEPLPTFVAHMLSEFRKLRTPPPQLEQIELICKHAVEKYRVALYGTAVTSVMDLLLRAHELHSVLGPCGRYVPQVPQSVPVVREVHCFKCLTPGYTSRNCPSCRLRNSLDVRSVSNNHQVEHTTETQSSEHPSSVSHTAVADLGASVRPRSGNFRGGRTFQRGNPPPRQ